MLAFPEPRDYLCSVRVRGSAVIRSRPPAYIHFPSPEWRLPLLWLPAVFWFFKRVKGTPAPNRQAENCENLFAAGDVCAYPAVRTGQRVRIEHWDVAMQQGRTAAANMLGHLG